MKKTINTKKGVIPLFFLFSLIIFSSFILAGSDYSERGTSSHDYSIQNKTLFNSFYNSLYGTPIYYSKPITNNQIQPPLITDFNDDGLSELIVSSSQEILIYQNRSLNFVNSYISPKYIFEYKSYDYAGEEYLITIEGVTSATPRYINIYVWNETINNIQNLTTLDMALNFNYKQAISFSCSINTGKCLVAGAYPTDILTYTFNLTNPSSLTHSSVSLRSRIGSNIMCFPSIPDISVDDITSDGIDDFILSYSEISTTGANYFDVFGAIVDINETGKINVIEETKIKDIDFNDGNTCQDYIFYYTAPLVSDTIDGSQPEFNIGMSINTNNFKLYTARYIGGSLAITNFFPTFFDGEGVIISNPIKANIYDDTGFMDYCVMGVTTNNASDLLCASPQTSEFLKSVEFKSDNFTTFFVPQDNTAQNIIHSVQAVVNIVNGEDKSEILTPFGIYQPDLSCSFFGSVLGLCQLDLIYPLEYTDGIASIGTLDNNPYMDLIYTTASNLIYIDDKYTNSNALIDAYSINPCITSVWKQNTSFEISVTPVDSENDKVQARMIVYADTENSQDSGWLGNYTSGTSITFSGSADNKTSSGVIKLQARDNKQITNTTYDEIVLSFAVADDGVIFGECQTISENIIASSIITNTTTESGITNTNNALTDWGDETAVTFGIPIIIVVLLFLGMMTAVILIAFRFNIIIGGIVAGIIDLMLIILFTLIGWIPTALTITLFALFITAGVMYFVHLFHKSAGG